MQTQFMRKFGFTRVASLGLGLLLMVVGCRKKAANPDATPDAAQLPKGTAPVVNATKSGEVGLKTTVVPNTPQAEAVTALNRDLASGNPQLVLKRLNELLDAQEMSGKGAPKSVEDLVRAGLLAKAPTAPAGQRYALNPKTRRFDLLPQ